MSKCLSHGGAPHIRREAFEWSRPRQLVCNAPRRESRICSNRVGSLDQAGVVVFEDCVDAAVEIAQWPLVGRKDPIGLEAEKQSQ